jgi:hypothetical protein
MTSWYHIVARRKRLSDLHRSGKRVHAVSGGVVRAMPGIHLRPGWTDGGDVQRGPFRRPGDPDGDGGPELAGSGEAPSLRQGDRMPSPRTWFGGVVVQPLEAWDAVD